jgi:hypothetical protein
MGAAGLSVLTYRQFKIFTEHKLASGGVKALRAHGQMTQMGAEHDDPIVALAHAL